MLTSNVVKTFLYYNKHSKLKITELRSINEKVLYFMMKNMKTYKNIE